MGRIMRLGSEVECCWLLCSHLNRFLFSTTGIVGSDDFNDGNLSVSMHFNKNIS